MIINWAEIPPTYESAEAFKALALETESKGLNKTKFFKYQRLNKLIGTYSSYGDEKGHCELRVFTDKPERHIYSASKADLGANEGLTGYMAYLKVEELFKKTHKESLYSFFSGNAYKQEYKDIKKCVPAQISYLNRRYAGIELNHVSKADVSSAFPAQIVGKIIPTLHDCKRIAGRIEPTEEYPFAFYVKSRHMAIYDELDTRTFANDWYREYYRYDDSIKEEETILCKGVKGELDDAFRYLYDNRKDNAEYKFFMNACIGFFHKDANPTLSAIAAVVIARCDNDMISRCRKISESGMPLFIATDSIAWLGGPSDIATDDKYLGSFTYEAVDCDFFAIGPKAYQVRFKDGTTITKYSGVKKDIRDSIPFGSMTLENGLADDSISCLAETKGGIYYPEKIM